MTYHHPNARLAMTAIAAVLALSSTPALAQDAGVPDPVVDTVIPTPDPVLTDPLAPAATITPADPVSAEVAPTTPRSSQSSRSTTTRSTATRVIASRATRSVAPVVSAVPAATVVSPPTVLEAPVNAPSPVEAQAAPIPPAAQPVTQSIVADQTLPIAGAAGLGLLALAGAGVALRRRKRRLEDEEEERLEAEQSMPVQAPEPAFARSEQPVHDPILAPIVPQTDVTTTALPNGFDLSRFGRHVQAAYRGPTTDNPSLSLKNRLRRASFFDQRERTAGATQPVPVGEATGVSGPTPPPRRDGDFMLRRDTARVPSEDPVFQS